MSFSSYLTCTKEEEQEARAFFASLTQREIKRRIDLCIQQMRKAYDCHDMKATLNLHAMMGFLREAEQRDPKFLR